MTIQCNSIGSSIMRLFDSLSRKPGISNELKNQLKALGHGNKLSLPHECPHKVLGQTRESLAKLRLGLDGQAGLSVIQQPISARFMPRFEYTYCERPSKILHQGKTVLMDTLSNQDITEMFNDPSQVMEIKNRAGNSATLTLAEFRIIQDYMGHDNLSRVLNQFLRGEKPENTRLTAQQMTEMATLLISALNALPTDAHPGIHCLKQSGHLFQTMLAAGKESRPFVPDSFISIKQFEDKGPQTQIPALDPRFGDALVVIRSDLARDVRDVFGKCEQEREAIIPPYESFDVTIFEPRKEGQPAMELTGRAKT